LTTRLGDDAAADPRHQPRDSAKGKDARFRKVERGRFEATAAARQ